MSRENPHIDKHHRIAVIGAGPAGIHLASLLKQRGYSNVTIFEKMNRIGGKSFTRLEDGVPYEMGTCFLHNGYHRIKELVQAYGLRESIPPEGRAIFLDEQVDHTISYEFSEFVSKALVDDWQQHYPQWKWLPAPLTKLRLLNVIWRYNRLYRQLFGTTKLPYGIPLHLSPDVLQRIDMTLLEFLQQNKLDPLIGILRIVQAAQGYGYLEKIPAYYGLCWVTPEFLMGFVKQAIGLEKITQMLPDGYETLWRTIAEKDALTIKLGSTIHSIDRKGVTEQIIIDYTESDGERQRKTYDFLILTINMRSALGLLKNPTKTEQRLFSVLEGFTLTTTLFESDPVPGFSTADYDKAIAYYPDVLVPSHNNEWYADRNDRHIFATANNLQKRFDRQIRVAFQFSDQVPGNGHTFTQDAEIAAKLEASWRERGVSRPQIIEQYVWPYFMHFPSWAIREGYLNDLFEYQGQYRTWYAGASVCFESVNHVVGYNHALVDTYL